MGYKNSNAISGAERWEPLSGGETYENMGLPKGILVLDGGSATLVDKNGNSVVIASQGVWPLSPRQVTAATAAYALF